MAPPLVSLLYVFTSTLVLGLASSFFYFPSVPTLPGWIADPYTCWSSYEFSYTLAGQVSETLGQEARMTYIYEVFERLNAINAEIHFEFKLKLLNIT